MGAETMKNFTKLEKSVMDWMAENLDIPNLKDNIMAAVVTDRKNTGIGVITSLSVPSDLSHINCSSPIIGPIIEADGIENGGTTKLLLDDS